MIEICPTFKHHWYNELNKLPFGFLKHRNGNSVMVDLILEDGQSFMKNGKNVGILFGFKQPTEVYLHYYIEHNNFTLTTISPAAEDDEMYVSDTGDYALREYDNDRHYDWEHIIHDKWPCYSFKGNILFLKKHKSSGSQFSLWEV
jgi:hypothetical protein